MKPFTQRKALPFLSCLIISLLLFTGCAKREAPVIGIAEQYGIAYAPLNIMKELGILERKLPGVKIEWKQFGGPTAIRESMMNGEIDFGFMGVAPVLIGIDNGMEWKYATGISSNEVAIVTSSPDIKSLKDFSPQDRIAILSPGCTQHVLLCMLADEQLGDPHALDNQTVSMTHPDAMHALLSGTEITAHIATPPYISQEVQAGMSVLATGEEIMGGPFTFISGVAMTDFYENHRDWYDAFIEALDESIDYINENMEECVRILAPIYGVSQEDLMEQMTYNGTIYSNQLKGVPQISAAMQKTGFTSGNPDFDTIIFDNVNQEKE
ncbi:MAG: ABC transporter substrate-binding protein [Hungatella sp.]|nr:ABC transporter substrate-binding protein [Hungatella sp.]